MSNYRRYEYDDPYKLLAANLAVHYNTAGLVHIMTDQKYVKRQVRREARQQDLRGHFIDCIIAATNNKAERQAILAELDKLGCYLYRQLDQPRLRAEIASFCEKCGVELPLPTEQPDIIRV